METDIFPLYTCVFSEFGENITDETVRKEMWPMIKRKFEEIDKAFS